MSYAFVYTQNVADTAEYKTITVPGFTGGAWNTTNGVGMSVSFAMASGTTYSASSANNWVAGNFVAAPGQVNGITATSDVFRITGVVVLPGIEAPSAARSPFIMRPFDQELVTCLAILAVGFLSNPWIWRRCRVKSRAVHHVRRSNARHADSHPDVYKYQCRNGDNRYHFKYRFSLRRNRHCDEGGAIVAVSAVSNARL